MNDYVVRTSSEYRITFIIWETFPISQNSRKTLEQTVIQLIIFFSRKAMHSFIFDNKMRFIFGQIYKCNQKKNKIIFTYATDVRCP